MTRYPDAKDALALIDQAAKKGTFIPVLGFELSCLHRYNVIPIRATGVFGNRSNQLIELDRQRARIDSIKNLLDSQTADYLEYFRPPTDAADSHADDPALIDLARRVTELACVLTQVWSSARAERPSPLGFASSEYVASASNSRQGTDAIVKMRAALDSCARLWISTNEGRNEPASLHIEWIYEKLLFLASNILDPELLWTRNLDDEHDPTSFRDRHRSFIQGRRDATNWSTPPRGDAPYQPKRPITSEIGVRRPHLLWLQGLIRHILLSGTKAYRTREELAFLLALDDQIPLHPDLTTDPFEIGLLYARTAQDNDTLGEALRYCESTDAAHKNSPQVFYWALARFLKKSRERCSDGYRSQKQIILSMCLDREMERALAREFPTFRVLIPVNKPLRGEGRKMSWCVLECQADETSALGYRIRQFIDPAEHDILLQHAGPLLIKMFGSPIESLPGPDPDVDYETAKYSHRLVLDETALLAGVDSLLPRNLITEMDSFLQPGRFFFFGQNAIRWSERVPYTLRRATSPQDYEGGSGSVLSIGETGVFGATALERLNVLHGAETVRPEDIIEGFILRAAGHD